MTEPGGVETLENKLPFLTHLEELRKRLVRCLIALLLGFLVCYQFASPIFTFLMTPAVGALKAQAVRSAAKAGVPQLAPGTLDRLPADAAAALRALANQVEVLSRQLDQQRSSLIFTGVSESFFTQLKVAFFASLMLVLPFILWQVWGFVSPGLFRKERKMLAGMVVASTLLFFAGASFCYWVVFPAAFGFFLSAPFVTEVLRPMLSMKEYLAFITRFLLAFGLIFQMPLLAYFFTRLGMVTYRGLASFRRYAIVVNFVIAAILTPTPDMVNQLLMAGPLIVLYEVSILVSRMTGKKEEAAA
jgi:sec-independent protein translocase protein TatC